MTKASPPDLPMPVCMTTWEPPPYTLDDFYRDFSEACKRAHDGHQHAPAVTLPEGVFPGLATVVDPMNGEEVRIQRAPLCRPTPRRPGL